MLKRNSRAYMFGYMCGQALFWVAVFGVVLALHYVFIGSAPW